MKIEVSRNAPDDSVETLTGSPAIAKNQVDDRDAGQGRPDAGARRHLRGRHVGERSRGVPYLHTIPILGNAVQEQRVARQPQGAADLRDAADRGEPATWPARPEVHPQRSWQEPAARTRRMRLPERGSVDLSRRCLWRAWWRRTIWLVGMMGAGQVRRRASAGPAPRAAAFVDTDAEVEARAGTPRRGDLRARRARRPSAARERAAIEALCRAARRWWRSAAARSRSRARAERLAGERARIVYLRARPETLADAHRRRRRAAAARRSRRRRAASRLARLARRAASRPTRRRPRDRDGRPAASRSWPRTRRAARRSRRGLSGEARRKRASARCTVELGERSYPIRLGVGHASRAAGDADRAAHQARARRRRHGARGGPAATPRRAALAARRRAAHEPPRRAGRRRAPRPAPGRRSSTSALLDAGADRGSVVVALGGGVVGDLAGFVAATYLRGVAFVQVPTTAARDGRRQRRRQGRREPAARARTWSAPSTSRALVWIDVATLRLAAGARQRAAGLAEVIKHGAIRDAGALRALSSATSSALLASTEPALLTALERACAIKAEVVREDEREAGLRMLLNFGHTLAHAVEALIGLPADPARRGGRDGDGLRGAPLRGAGTRPGRHRGPPRGPAPAGRPPDRASRLAAPGLSLRPACR